MVQRKLVNKLGIQADHVIFEKGSFPSQNQDNNKNNKGADLKKKMKKSRSTKHSDSESLTSTPPVRNKDIPQPGKPPTSDHVKTRTATPQRQSPVKAPEASPNYMKSTSSFDARKERCQVSSQALQNVMIRKSMSPIKLNNSSGSDHKTVGGLARTSNLKLVRTLTKTPSFKPARSSTKKYSPKALCQDFDVQKPTCSSTLKDSKFPTYLELSVGATESEGTSAMKVCPYTYCSLNGHHHAPVPPLKNFLSAKRRMLKAQRSIKLGCLSPRRAKPSREIMIKIDTKQVILAKIPPTKEKDSFRRPMTPPTQEKQTDFFVDADASDMEWEAGNHCESNLSDVPTLKIKVTDIFNGSKLEPISKLVDDVNNSYEDMLADEVRVGFYDEKSVSSGAWSVDGESDSDGSYQNMFFDASENSRSTDEEDGHSESLETQGKENIISLYIEEFEATTVEKRQSPNASDEIQKRNFQLGPDGTKCSSNVEEVLFELQKDEASQEECGSWLLQNQDCSSVQDFMEQDQDQTHNDYNKIQNSMEVFEFDFTTQSRFRNDVPDESFLAKTEDEKADQEDHDQKISIADARDGMEEKEILASQLFDRIQTSESLEDNEQQQPIAHARDGMEEKEQLLAAKTFVGIQPFELLQEIPEPIQDMIAVNNDQSKQTDVSIESGASQSYVDEVIPYESNGVENLEYPESNRDQTDSYKFTGSKYFEDQKHSEATVLQATPHENREANAGEGEYKTEPDTAERCFIAKPANNTEKSDYISNASSNFNEEMTKTLKNSSWTYGSRKTVAELEDIRDFNPREPNYLPVEPDLEAEKVDLRHQMIDERKNAEEWMVDYALRQAVTKLAPAFRRKVSLLVEAFEKVLPTPKYETHPRRTSPAFVHAGTIQACR